MLESELIPFLKDCHQIEPIFQQKLSTLRSIKFTDLKSKKKNNEIVGNPDFSLKENIWGFLARGVYKKRTEISQCFLN